MDIACCDWLERDLVVVESVAVGLLHCRIAFFEDFGEVLAIV